MHVWGGISYQRKTPIVILEGLMTATGIIAVYKARLFLYLNKVNTNLRVMQNNDPKHTSTRVSLKTWVSIGGKPGQDRLIT